MTALEEFQASFQPRRHRPFFKSRLLRGEKIAGTRNSLVPGESRDEQAGI